MIPIPKVVAEIGCNHMGRMEIAKEMITVAAGFCQVGYVKFQKRNPKELLSPSEYQQPHPVPANSFGDTYGAHREKLEFTLDQHRELQAWCQENGAAYACSVWDLTSAKEIVGLNPAFVKVPSATNTHTALIEYLGDEFGGEIHVSLGMTTRQELDRLIRLLDGRGRLGDTVLYACTSGYPVGFEDICLLEITRLREEFGARVKAVGYSGHHLGIAVDVAAMTLGAEWIERHFTLDRTWKGTDHAASLEPDGLRRLARDLANVNKALRIRPTEILDIEQEQRRKLKWKNDRKG